MNETAERTSWKNYPIDNPKRITIDLRFTESQLLRLKKGLIPQQMEDKWFIFFENDWLYFHRSWTGFGVYKVQIVKSEDSYAINEFWAERNTEKYKNDVDDFDIDTLSFLIARGLLGIDVNSTYASKYIKTEEDSIKGWSNFGNLLF